MDAMEKALERADRVLAVYSTSYFTRPFARAEHRAATASAMSSRAGRVIPVVVEQCEIPELYRTIIVIDLVGLSEAEAAQRLVARVSGAPGPPAGSVAFPGAATPELSDAEGTRRAIGYPGRLPPLWNVPSRNPFFSGRGPLIDEVRRQLARPRAPGNRGVVPLRGMGGVGKTQLAVEFAYQRAGDYQLVWWVDAGNASLANAGLVELAAALSLDTSGRASEVIRRLWVVLANRDDWLLIYDNADNPLALGLLRPPSTGDLVVTGRDAMIGRLGVLVEVPEFDRVESIALLHARCPRLSEAEADLLASAAGDLPLAIEQIGCFLQETSLSVRDFLVLLAAEPQAAALSDPTLDAHPGLAAVVTLSRERLSETDPGVAATLDQLAFLGSGPLPLAPRNGYEDAEQHRFGLKIGDGAETARFARVVTRLGLALRGGAAIRLHRLVRALLRARMGHGEQLEALACAQELLLHAGLRSDPEDVEGWPQYAVLAPHLEALAEYLTTVPEAGAVESESFRALQLGFSQYLYATGQYQNSEALIRHAYSRWTFVLGDEHQDTLRAGYRLAAALMGSDDFSNAGILAEDIRARSARLLGENHHLTLNAAATLARAKTGLGDFVSARALSQEVFTRRLETLGPDNSSTLRAAGVLANALMALGEYAAARSIYRDSYDRLIRVLGVDHRHTLSVASTLADAELEIGNYGIARVVLEETLERQRRVLGADHAETLFSASVLTAVLLKTGDPGARALAEDTEARYRRTRGTDDPHSLQASSNLAEAMALTGELPQARVLFAETLAKMSRVIGENHALTLYTATLFGAVLIETGELAAAQSTLDETLARQKEVLGESHPDTLKTLEAINRLEERRDR